MPSNYVNALGGKLDILLSDGAMQQKMGRNSSKYADKNFSIAVEIERLLKIYQEL